MCVTLRPAGLRPAWSPGRSISHSQSLTLAAPVYTEGGHGSQLRTNPKTLLCSYPHTTLPNPHSQTTVPRLLPFPRSDPLIPASSSSPLLSSAVTRELNLSLILKLVLSPVLLWGSSTAYLNLNESSVSVALRQLAMQLFIRICYFSADWFSIQPVFLGPAPPRPGTLVFCLLWI